MSNDLTRPIIGIENRTAEEVFDIMADWIRYARPSPAAGVDGDARRLALEDADALERTAEEADENGWMDWAATMRQSAARFRSALRAAQVRGSGS